MALLNKFNLSMDENAAELHLRLKWLRSKTKRIFYIGVKILQLMDKETCSKDENWHSEKS
jgi:hypothetical protein